MRRYSAKFDDSSEAACRLAPMIAVAPEICEDAGCGAHGAMRLTITSAYTRTRRS